MTNRNVAAQQEHTQDTRTERQRARDARDGTSPPHSALTAAQREKASAQATIRRALEFYREDAERWSVQGDVEVGKPRHTMSARAYRRDTLDAIDRAFEFTRTDLSLIENVDCLECGAAYGADHDGGCPNGPGEMAER
jgi:hypothetical protein